MTEATTTERAEEVVESRPQKKLSSDESFWSIVWRQYCKDRLAVGGLVIVAGLIGLAVLSPFLASGLPYTITGVLTNFYSNDVAAFRDWHHLYRQRADELEDAGKLKPTEKAEKEADAELYRRGLPRILARLETYLAPADAKALHEVETKYDRLLEVAPPKLDRDEYEALGRTIEEKFGALAFEPAYKLVGGPLATFAYPGSDGSAPLKKRVQDAADEARAAQEDNDAQALGAAQKKLAALTPELDETAKRVEAGVKVMAGFLPDDAAKQLEQIATDLAASMRAMADPKADASATDSKFQELSSKIDLDFARRPIAPEKERLPLTTQHPVLDYLSAMEIAFLVLYVTGIAAYFFRTPFARWTAQIHVDPSDLGLVRIGVLLTPALVVFLLWTAVVPDREPPSDSYYKSFAQNLAEHPDPRSSITFAPVPYGENENIQEDKVCPPTWLESKGHILARLLTSQDFHDPALAMQTAGDAAGAFDAAFEAKPGSELAKKLSEKNVDLEKWQSAADALIAKRLTRARYHWLGTDRGGRDALARIIMGARISLSVGIVAVALECLIGILLGALAGYFGGWLDIVISRFTEIVMCVPSFFLILALMAIVQKPNIFWIMGVLGLTGWTGVMRLVRGEFLRLVSLDFVTAGRALGLTNARVIFRHVLPNALAPVLVSATFGVAGAILTESALSFLGFGVQPPTASWGSVLNEAFGAEKEMWWITVFPGFMIFLTITAYNLVGEGFRDATDPKLRK